MNIYHLVDLILYEKLGCPVGTFLLKKRAEKKGRNISKGTCVKIPAHFVPAFKPAKEFVVAVKAKVVVK